MQKDKSKSLLNITEDFIQDHAEMHFEIQLTRKERN